MQYSEAIRSGFRYLLKNDPSVLVIGQGLWSPWYVGDTMRDLETEFGADRIIDTPVSELACTGASIGAAMGGYRTIMTHPRVDFSLLAIDQMVNQAAKWNSMFGGGAPVPVVFRLIVNRGGEQGAQHSQSLYSWFAHIPGLRVVVPATPQDAQDLLIAATLSDDPVVYIDDRWLYEWDLPVSDPVPVRLATQGPVRRREGNDVTLVGLSWTTRLLCDAADNLAKQGIHCDVVDLRVLNPFKHDVIAESVQRTGRLIVAEGDWKTCGIGAEVIAGVMELAGPGVFKSAPRRISLADAPAPTSKPLESEYYPTISTVTQAVEQSLKHSRSDS